MITFGLLLLCAGSALSQGVHGGFTCPQDDGFYADPNQCDKYYDCYRGEMTEKLCQDGLVFDATLSPRVEQCNYPFIVECPLNSVLQPAQSTGVECPRMNGYFEHEDPANCVNYYECTNGTPVKRSCFDGLVFDELTGSCQWEHTRIRTGCGVQVEYLDDGFSCPNETQLASNGHPLKHTRFPDLNDCRNFYVCYNGKYPRSSGCGAGTVYNDVTLQCDAPENVPGCENYYEGLPQQQIQPQAQQPPKRQQQGQQGKPLAINRA